MGSGYSFCKMDQIKEKA